MVNLNKTFWENIKDYDKEITSIFIKRNKLTNYLKNIPNKNKKIIYDFGCGTGNSILFIKKFKKIYEIDFSESLLNIAKQKYEYKNIEFINSDINQFKFRETADIILAANSIFPNSYEEFMQIISKFKKKINHDGEILLVLPSMESLTLFYQIYYYHHNGDKDEIITLSNQIKFNPLGFILTRPNLVQKHWIKEEIELYLKKFKFKNVIIEKLEMDWKTQIKLKDYSKYPKYWFWFVKIKK